MLHEFLPLSVFPLFFFFFFFVKVHRRGGIRAFGSSRIKTENETTARIIIVPRQVRDVQRARSRDVTINPADARRARVAHRETALGVCALARVWM